jgi:hypothetical protein
VIISPCITFTFYEKQETFIEEVLMAEVPVRRGKLLVEWGMSMQDLLDFVIAHELGHALCNEKDEAKANRVARMLQEQKPYVCEFKLASQDRPKVIRKRAVRTPHPPEGPPLGATNAQRARFKT